MANHVKRIKTGEVSNDKWKTRSGIPLFCLLLTLSIMILISCEQKTARTIDMYNPSKDMVGTVKLTEQPDGVKAKVKVEGISPGFHGIHIHEFPDCSGSDFKNAGNHLNPTRKEHGLMNSKGAHLGDLPNIKVGSDGKMKGEVTVIDGTLLDGKNSIMESSIVITEGKDDGVTQPGGESGKRIICGEIKKKSKQDKESPTDPTE